VGDEDVPELSKGQSMLAGLMGLSLTQSKCSANDHVPEGQEVDAVGDEDVPELSKGQSMLAGLMGLPVSCSYQAEAMQEVNLLELRPNLQSARAAPDTIMPVVPSASSTEEANGHSNHGTRLNTKLVHPSKGQSTVTSLMKLVDPASTPSASVADTAGAPHGRDMPASPSGTTLKSSANVKLTKMSSSASEFESGRASKPFSLAPAPRLRSLSSSQPQAATVQSPCDAQPARASSTAAAASVVLRNMPAPQTEDRAAAPGVDVVRDVFGRGAEGMEEVVQRLSQRGWCVCEGGPEAEAAVAVAQQEAEGLWRAQRMAPGQVVVANQALSEINELGQRGDMLLWLAGSGAKDSCPALKSVDCKVEAFGRRLRQSLSAAASVRLTARTDSMVTCYPGGGTKYGAHVDNPDGDGREDGRKITMVFYLNKDWTPKVGGKLRIYEGKDLDSKYVDVEPLGNRLVVFWSDSVLHEVSM